jgi:hypothetical protein
MRSQGHLWRQRQKFLAVLPSQVRDRTDRPFFPEQLVGNDGMSLI